MIFSEDFMEQFGKRKFLSTYKVTEPILLKSFLSFQFISLMEMKEGKKGSFLFVREIQFFFIKWEGRFVGIFKRNEKRRRKGVEIEKHGKESSPTMLIKREPIS